jgi:sortase B
MEDRKKRGVNMKKQKKIWIGILVIAVITCVACSGYYGYIKYQDKKAEEKREAILEEMATTEFTGEVEGEEPEIPEGIRHEEDVDFDKLTDINDEIYAWIYIPNTKVDYPIAQSATDNSYYLNYNMNKEPEFAGCIYTESYNNTDFNDPMTVIYGHNMKNKSMFGSLHSFEDSDFFKENEYVYIYTPKKILTYHIFAAYEFDNRHLMKTYDFNDSKKFANYIKSIYKVNTMISNYRKDVKVTNKDKIITLSTCASGKPDNRYLVQAVLEDVKTKE